jgi:hypothetical protein
MSVLLVLACSCCVSMLHDHAACPRLRVLAAYPCCLSMLHGHAAYACWVSKLNANAANQHKLEAKRGNNKKSLCPFRFVPVGVKSSFYWFIFKRFSRIVSGIKRKFLQKLAEVLVKIRGVAISVLDKRKTADWRLAN